MTALHHSNPAFCLLTPQGSVIWKRLRPQTLLRRQPQFGKHIQSSKPWESESSPQNADICVLPSVYTATVSRSGEGSQGPVQHLASDSGPVHWVGACPWGPQAKTAHGLATLLTWLRASHLCGQWPGIWRLMSLHAEGKGTPAVWLCVSGLPRSQVPVADGQKPRWTPGGFLAGPLDHSCPLQSQTSLRSLFCTGSMLSPTQTQQGHTPGNGSSHLLSPQGRKWNLQSNTGRPALSVQICAKRRA